MRAHENIDEGFLPQAAHELSGAAVKAARGLSTDVNLTKSFNLIPPDGVPPLFRARVTIELEWVG